MAENEILKLKEEVADKYIQEFKKELNFLEKSVVVISERKMKALLLEDKELGTNIDDVKKRLNTVEGFFFNILQKLSSNTIDKIFSFLQEKQKVILRAQTQEDLKNLKDGVIKAPEQTDNSNPAPADHTDDNVGDQSDHQDNTDQTDHSDHTHPVAKPADTKKPEEKKKPIVLWAKPSQLAPEKSDKQGLKHLAVGGGIMAAGVTAEVVQNRVRKSRLQERFEGFSEELNEGKVKNSLQDIEKSLQAKLDYDNTLLPAQKKNIQRLLDIFKKGEKSTDAVAELKIRKQLVAGGKMSNALFAHVTPETITAMQQIAADKTLAESLANAKTEQEVQKILTSKWMTNVSKDVVAVLAKTNVPEDVLSIARVLGKSEKLMLLARMTKAIPYIQIAYMGLSTYNFSNATEEVGKMANHEKGDIVESKNTFHYAVDMTTSSAAAFLLPALMSAGPAGWIGIGVIAAGEAINYAADSLYFDVKEFYATNKDEFITQYRTEVKQAIIQAAAGASRTDLSINESVCEFFGGVDKQRKMKTLDDAVRAMLYLEEVKHYPEVMMMDKDKRPRSDDEKKLYDEKRAEIDKKIAARMEYISSYLPGGLQNSLFNDQIKSEHGLQFLEKIIAESSVAAQMKQDTEIHATTIAEYIDKKKEQLQSKNSRLFSSLETLSKNSPAEFSEFSQKVELFKSALSTNADYADTYKSLHETVDFVRDFFARKKLWVSSEQDESFVSLMDMDYVDMEKTLKKLGAKQEIAFSPTLFSDEQLKERVLHWWDNDRFTEAQQYSDHIGQNVIYRIAKEFHGYEWANDMQQLQLRFTPGKDKSLGLYFDQEAQKRKIHNDTRYSPNAPIDLHDLETKPLDEILDSWFKEISVIQPDRPDDSGPLKVDKKVISTPTKTTDVSMTNEFKARFASIVTQEKAAFSKEKQAEAQKDITTYITAHAAEGYIKLPYYLVIEGARAGLGNVQYFYFTLKEGKIHACSSAEYIALPLHLDAVREYVDLAGQTKDKPDMTKVTVHALSDADRMMGQQIDAMTEKIQKIASEVSRQGRGNVLYDPEKKEVISRWGRVYCDKWADGKWHVGKTKETLFPIMYDTMEEAVRTANLLNRFADRKKTHKLKLEFTHDYIDHRTPYSLMDRGSDSSRWRNGTHLIDSGTLKKHFPHIVDTEKDRDAFIEYITNTL